MRYDLKRLRASTGKEREDVSTRHLVIDKFPGANHVGTGTYFSDGEAHAQFTLFATSALENTTDGTVTLAGQQISGQQFDLWVRKEDGEVVELTWTIPTNKWRLFEATFIPSDSRRESDSSTKTMFQCLGARKSKSRRKRRRRKTRSGRGHRTSRLAIDFAVAPEPEPEDAKKSKRRRKRRKKKKRRKTRAKNRTKSRSHSLFRCIRSNSRSESFSKSRSRAASKSKSRSRAISRTLSRVHSTRSRAPSRTLSRAQSRHDFLRARSRSRSGAPTLANTRSRAQTKIARRDFLRAKTLWEGRSKGASPFEV